MPIFKARQEQPPGVPSRSSSVPPIHLHSPRLDHNVSSATCLAPLIEQSTPTKATKPQPDAFAWHHLPQHIRQGILAHALLPDGPDRPIAIGLAEHRAHLNAIAVPIFLALGSWNAYINAASIFYQHIHLNLALFQDSSMTFLTSPATLRPRSLVVRIQLHFTIKEHLLFFDTGYTVSHSMGKPIKMNIPTALRSMRAHGRLGEVELLILKGLQVGPEGGSDTAVPGYYFPMAKVQLGGWTPVAGSDDLLEPAEVIIAPAFLACRSFQSGLLPLLEYGVFEKMRLALQSCSNAEGDMIRDDHSITAHEVDRNAFVQYWLGATVLELLDTYPAEGTWADPFPITAQCGADVDEAMVDVADHLVLQEDQEFVPSRETRHDLGSSPIKYPSSSSGSDSDSSSDVVVINFKSLRDDSHQEEENPSRRERELPDDDTSSEDSSSSEEVVRGLHTTYGAAPPKQDSTDGTEARNGFGNNKDEGSSSASEFSKDSSPSPAAIHLEIARAELITTLTAAAARDDTMEAIARAAEDPHLTSYGATRAVPCKHDDDTVVECSALSSEDDEASLTPTWKVPPVTSAACSISLDKTTPRALVVSTSTRYPGDDEADSDTDAPGSSSTSGPGSERGHEVSPEDLTNLEDIFGARAGDDTSLNVHGEPDPTDCILTSGSEDAERGADKDKGRAVSVDLGFDGRASYSVSASPAAQAEAEIQAATSPAQTNNPKRTALTTPAPRSSDSKPLTPLSARSKGPVKSKGTQTKGQPNKPAKTNHTQGEKAKPAAAAESDRATKKRKAPPAASNGQGRASRSKRRRRARAAKEKQLQLAKQIEAEAAEREETLVN